MEKEEVVNGVKNRVKTVRLRTWTLTLALVVTLGFYYAFNIITKKGLSWIDFGLLCTLQIVVHCLYFPDGELFGKKDKKYQTNYENYNSKATEINEHKLYARLREFCKVDFEERKKRYIERECSKIGITIEELEELKEKDEKFIRSLKTYEINETENGEIVGSRLLVLSKHKRKMLYNLLFKALPVEENYPETIMSAVENNGNEAIKDRSSNFKRQSYIKKIFKAVVVGGILAYITWNVKDGFGWNEVFSIMVCLTTLFTNAVMSFTSGETCSKVYKNTFYLELANFIDVFNEWEKNNK